MQNSSCKSEVPRSGLCGLGTGVRIWHNCRMLAPPPSLGQPARSAVLPSPHNTSLPCKAPALAELRGGVLPAALHHAAGSAQVLALAQHLLAWRKRTLMQVTRPESTLSPLLDNPTSTGIKLGLWGEMFTVVLQRTALCHTRLRNIGRQMSRVQKEGTQMSNTRTQLSRTQWPCHACVHCSSNPSGSFLWVQLC